jgi:hypothetical protein
MLGWLRGFEPFLAMIRLRTLAGGWMDLVMILTGLLGLICDLATNLVTTAYCDRRCSFVSRGEEGRLFLIRHFFGGTTEILRDTGLGRGFGQSRYTSCIRIG